MKITILYRPSSEQARTVEEFARDFDHQHNAKAELISIDTREGAAIASLYDIMAFPCIMVLRDDGQMVRDWSGGTMPLMNEVMGAYRS